MKNSVIHLLNLYYYNQPSIYVKGYGSILIQMQFIFMQMSFWSNTTGVTNIWSLLFVAKIYQLGISVSGFIIEIIKSQHDERVGNSCTFFLQGGSKIIDWLCYFTVIIFLVKANYTNMQNDMLKFRIVLFFVNRKTFFIPIFFITLLTAFRPTLHQN